MFPKFPLGVLSSNSLNKLQEPSAQLLRILSLVNDPFLKLQRAKLRNNQIILLI